MSQICMNCKYYQKLHDRLNKTDYRICWVLESEKKGQGQFVDADGSCEKWEVKE